MLRHDLSKKISPPRHRTLAVLDRACGLSSGVLLTLSLFYLVRWRITSAHADCVGIDAVGLSDIGPVIYTFGNPNKARFLLRASRPAMTAASGCLNLLDPPSAVSHHTCDGDRLTSSTARKKT
jgi:hypothetical protein